MWFGVLGPLLVRAGPGEVRVARRERVLLALLLLHANRTVGQERVVDAIWGERPPADSTGQVHSSVYRLRKALAAAGGSGGIVVTDPAGYRVRVDAQRLDLAQFRELRDQARATAGSGEPEQARELYRAALDLWRGRALDGVDSDAIRYAAAGLDEEHVQAAEECIEVELALGRSREVVAELTELVGQHPHREGLHRALMLALYRAGRQADALAAYRSARALLADELGLEPGPELQRLHQAILNRDRQLDLPRVSPPAAAGRVVPRELPADVAGFTGRGDALKALDGLVGGTGDGSSVPVVISAIAGTAGIGKTALAVHWGHQVVDRFPDGQLYVNLRGYDPDQPVAPADALARFLSGLGVAGQDIPLELADRAARYRTEVTERQMLIVLDNAASVEQVRPLLPGTGSCAVVVTSRDSLAGLVAVDGAHRLDLDLLPPADAVTLLRRLIGDRVDAEPDAALTLVELCARLPLALRVAAELAASRPRVPLADLVVELSDRQRRLELLDADGDPHAAVREVFSWSIRRLPPETARMFRLLGLHPGPDFDAYAAAALTDTTLEQATRALDQLTRAHLVHSTTPGRYAMHDLLRAYATYRASDEDSDEERQAVLTRMFDYYLGTAAAAMDTRYPAEAHRRPRVPLPTTPAPKLADPDAGLKWLDFERACLVAATVHSNTHGWSTYTIRLSATLYRYLNGGHYSDALAVHSCANHAAEQAESLPGQAEALRHLGATHWHVGAYSQARCYLRQAIALFQRIGDPAGEASALNNLGYVEKTRSRYWRAIEHHRMALDLCRIAGDEIGEASALTGIGNAEECLGRCESAAGHHAQAIALFREVGDEAGAASAHNNLANAEERLGRFESSAVHYKRAHSLYRKTGDLQGQALALEGLGIVYLRVKNVGRAIASLQHALKIYRDIGERTCEAWALNGLGEATLADQRPNDAIIHHSAALTVAGDNDITDQRARAHAGLGRAHLVLDDHARAHAHYEQALGIYTELEMPEAEQVRERLAQLADEAGG
ncbi:MAG: BTAD domain-containing putative transcriptional regulator [Natronosporangium sp.]